MPEMPLPSEGEKEPAGSDRSRSRNSGFRGAVSIIGSERDVFLGDGSKFSVLPAAKLGLPEKHENKIVSASRREFIFFKNFGLG
ncbi:hypothetical protein MSWHS_1753 [Methanosarcina sp. WWM596]|nr:hypothetical protein MSWHS_1753 [Methanosarcina sp. WWM596]AKB21828.1 hypothetical protein MSWH1_1557 [Methanosarcina sp. WH1]